MTATASEPTTDDLRLPRSLWVLVASQSASLVGVGMTQIALPLWVFQDTGSAIGAGASFAVQFAPIVLLMPWAGLLADRYDRRKVMVTCELLSALAVLGLLAAARLHNLVLLLLGLAVVSAVNAVTMPAMQAVIVNTVPQELRGKSATVTEAMLASVTMLAPLAGTVLLGYAGLSAVLLVELCFFAYSAAMLTFLAPCPGQPELRNAARSIKNALAVAVRRRTLATVMAIEAAYFLLWGADMSIALLIADDAFGTRLAGVCAASAGLGWVITAAVLSRTTRRPLHALGFTAAGVPVGAVGFVLAAPHGPLAVVLPCVLLGAANMAMVSGASMTFQTQADPDSVGRLYAARRALLNSMLFISYLMLPAVSATRVGRTYTLVGFSVLTALAVGAGTLVARRAQAASAIG